MRNFKTKNKTPFLLLTTLAILTIILMGTVNATDQTISTTTNGGLKTAINNADNGQTIYIENGLYSGKDNTNLTISKNLTISGKGNNVVIDAQKISNIFNIDPNIKVTLKNLKLINGKKDFPYYGGAINNNGANLSVNNCTFTNNQADRSGGAINNNGNLSVNNCSFTNNQANTGGAINNNGNLSVNNCSFTNNQAKHDAGAINNNGNFSVDGSTFTNNQADWTGGAIYSDKTKISNSNFTNNQASDGGAINNKGSLFVSSCTFTNNKATSAVGMGGAICSSGDSLSVNGSTFTNNQAKYGGGAIDGDPTVNKCTFTNNQAKGYGGAIRGWNIKVSNSKFMDNKAKKNGGAITGGNLRINTVTFKNNMARNKYNAIYVYPTGEFYKNKITIIPSEPKKADLTITKIQKKDNYHHITIKNIGNKGTNNKFYLSIYIDKKQIKKTLVNTLNDWKSTTVKILLAKKYKNTLKTFKADSTNRIKESNEKNNSLKSK